MATETALRDAAVFVTVTFVLALAVYVPIIASARGLIPADVPPVLAVLGIFSPGVAAVLLRVRSRGLAGVRSALLPLSVWRFDARWWAVTLFLAPATIAVTYAAYRLLGGVARPPPVLAYFGGPLGLAVVPVLVAVVFLEAAGEEVGWRGYLLPRLRARYGAAAASVLLGVVWFLWHVPLTFVPGSGNEGFPLPLWGVSIVASAVVFTWLYENTGGSALATTVYHAAFNVTGQFVALHPSVTGDPLSAYVVTGGNVAIALLLVAAYGTDSFARDAS